MEVCKMPVPDFQTILLPMLTIFADKQQHMLLDCVKNMEIIFALTEDEKTERIPSGRQRKIYNRTAWAGTYLRKAGLMQAHDRGIFSICWCPYGEWS
jgi:restriction system protein